MIRVGQTIGLCRLLPRAFGPRNFMKKWGRSTLSRPFGRFWVVTCFQCLTLVFRPCQAAMGVAGDRLPHPSGCHTIVFSTAPWLPPGAEKLARLAGIPAGAHAASRRGDPPDNGGAAS